MVTSSRVDNSFGVLSSWNYWACVFGFAMNTCIDLNRFSSAITPSKLEDTKSFPKTWILHQRKETNKTFSSSNTITHDTSKKHFQLMYCTSNVIDVPNSLTNKFKHKWVYHSSHTLYTIADTHSKARRIAETISSKRKLHKIIFCQECAHVSTCFPSRSFVLLLAL